MIENTLKTLVSIRPPLILGLRNVAILYIMWRDFADVSLVSISSSRREAHTLATSESKSLRDAAWQCSMSLTDQGSARDAPGMELSDSRSWYHPWIAWGMQPLFSKYLDWSAQFFHTVYWSPVMGRSPHAVAIWNPAYHNLNSIGSWRMAWGISSSCSVVLNVRNIWPLFLYWSRVLTAQVSWPTRLSDVQDVLIALEPGVSTLTTNCCPRGQWWTQHGQLAVTVTRLF